MSSFTKAATWVGKTNEEYSVTTRAAGAAQAVFGAIGFAGAVGGAILTAPTGIGLVGFGALAAIELDQAVAGVRTAWTGEYQTSYIAEGISNVTGINAEYADVGLGFAGVTTSVVAGGKATLRWIGSGKAVNAAETALPAVGGHIPNAGGVIRQFTQQRDQVYYRVFSGDSSVGSFLTAVPPRSGDYAREALALPPGNQATFIQEVLVPNGTPILRSRALPQPAWGRTRGGAEQFELLEHIPKNNFGPGRPLP